MKIDYANGNRLRGLISHSSLGNGYLSILMNLNYSLRAMSVGPGSNGEIIVVHYTSVKIINDLFKKIHS